VECLALRGSHVRPFHVYAVVIAAAIVVAVLHIRRFGMPQVAADELAFVAINFGITLLMFASFGGHHEHSIRTAAWPLSNILMGACLFYFARAMDFGPIISAAATGALAVQILGIIIDLWIPGILAQWAARPAGFPQNPNNGALLICFLLALLLPAQLGDQSSRRALVGFAGCYAFVLVTLSRSGHLLYLGVALIFAIGLSISKTKERLLDYGIALGAVALSVAIIVFSPSLMQPNSISMWRSRVGFAAPDVLPNFAVTANWLPRPMSVPRIRGIEKTQAELDEFIAEADDSIRQRSNTFKFFFGEALKRPMLGAGSGWTSAFTRGPHNQFLSLFVEQGIFAAALHLLSMACLTLIAIRRRAVSLLAIAGLGWGNSMFSHTVLIEPWFLVFSLVALGLTKPVLASRQAC
jgi:hypothetical protein